MNIDERLALLTTNIESLHASVHELYGITQEHTKQIREHARQLDKDGEHIGALARIAEIHARRPGQLEGE